MLAMKRWIVLCLLMAPVLASAESYWDGSAALQRGDAAFESGLYAASNSFAPDTRLSILNLDNGKSTTATVSERVEGQSDILVFLSPRAADAIGITAGGIARVRITVLQRPPSPAGASTAENAYSADQDLNPGVAYGSATDQESTGEQASSQQPAGNASADESSEATEDAQILAEAEARHPQKQLFLPPREDQKFTYKPPAQGAASQPVASTPEQPEVPTVTGEAGAPSQRAAEVPMAEAQPQAPATPEETVGGAPRPSQPEGTTQLALPEAGKQPTPSEQQGMQVRPGAAEGEKIALQPPENPPQQATSTGPTAPGHPAAVPETSKANGVQVVASLPRLSGKKNNATFYVQLGAYETERGAQDIAEHIVQTYPVVVLAPSETGKQMYKVLVGPLNKAESGTLLPLFKFRGFRDAFVRRE